MYGGVKAVFLYCLARLYEITINEETNSPEPAGRNEIAINVKELPVASTFAVIDKYVFYLKIKESVYTNFFFVYITLRHAAHD